MSIPESESTSSWKTSSWKPCRNDFEVPVPALQFPGSFSFNMCKHLEVNYGSRSLGLKSSWVPQKKSQGGWPITWCDGHLSKLFGEWFKWFCFSGNLLHNYGKWSFSLLIYPLKMVILYSFWYVYQRVVSLHFTTIQTSPALNRGLTGKSQWKLRPVHCWTFFAPLLSRLVNCASAHALAHSRSLSPKGES